ncbi:type II secretion system secretin GspD [Paraliomyxa miuraensis]|uniref:type II secretion system secretin GspD n=1 Tax=Paraliomyxa miuraensis TaxID=376150 RepID=UPI00225649F6|nr:type II secretion system secretin GspD [Paraliomyxa miuraensis]MCX4242948.1 type II secretion system secretin GspD [Paraliomyxa miuraensis]
MTSASSFLRRASVALALTVAGAPSISSTALAAPPTTRGRPTPPSTMRPGTVPSPRAGSGSSGGSVGGGAELSGDEGGVGHNTCRKQPRGAKFRITLPKEAELQDLVNWMMSISCQKFILDLKARAGKVTILSPEPVSIDEAYAAFYAALQTMGLTVEPSGKYFKIVETSEVKGRTLPVYGPESRAPNNDRYVTQLYRTKGDPKDVVDLINKLKSKQGSVDAVGDLVIFTDTGASVRRLLKIVRQVDESDTRLEKIFFFQLQYADPEETAEMIREIFGEGEAGKGTKGKATAKDAGEPGFSRVIVDDRTGTLIVVAPEADYEVIRRLVERLDVPLAGGGGRINVVRLKNADPEEVANVLSQLGQGGGGGGGGGRGGRGGNQANAAPAAAAAELFSGEVKITPDPSTRSLVILASQSDFRALKEVIDVLDAERKQIYIEVYLLELSLSRKIQGGASAHFGANVPVGDVAGTSGDGLGFVASSPEGKNSVLLDPSLLNGIAAGVLGPQVQGSGQFLGLGQDIPAFGVIIQAVADDTDVNLVAQPHLYTADNQEASIEVGRNVPTQGALAFPGGGQGGGLVPVQSVNRQDVSLKVTITPHVNDEKTVTLDIEMENNDIEATSPTLGVTTTKRRLKLDKVLGRDDQPIVLGGLVQEVERESTSEVPGLGKIPLLGWLFKRKSKQKEKINLMMVLVPHILETPEDARRIHKQRMEERLEFLERESAFERKDLSTSVNYRKKSGLLATVNQEADRMVIEEALTRAAEEELQQQQITGELGLSPKLYEDEEEDEPSPSSPTTTPTPPKPPRGTRPSSGGRTPSPRPQ